MKVLIVKIGAIGDVAMALPLVSHFHGSHLTWVVGKTALPLLEATGAIDEILVVDEERLFKESLWQRCKELGKIQMRLALKRFDLILIGNADWRYSLIPLFARGKTVKRFRPSGAYHAQEYLRLVGSTSPVQFPPLSIPPSKVVDQALGKTKPIVLVPGGARNILADDALRRWPVQFYASLAEKLQSQGIPVVLAGSASDEWVLPFFSGVECVSLIGKLELMELLALCQRARLLITHDTGPLHLAKLVRCPTIALFGPTDPFEKVGAEENIKVLWGGHHLPCRPCYNGKTYARCTKNECMQSLSVEQVLREALSFLAGKIF